MYEGFRFEEPRVVKTADALECLVKLNRFLLQTFITYTVFFLLCNVKITK
jgi:hypothetical protein